MRVSRRDFLGCALTGLTYATVPKNIFIPGRRSKTLKFAYLTDLHASEEHYVESAYERIFEALKKEKVDLILGGGDWITEGNFITISQAKKRFERFNSFWSALPGQKILIPGNHDFVKSSPESLPDLSLYQTIFGPINTSIDLSGTRLLTLQSLTFSINKNLPYTGEVSKQQLKWLSLELDKIGSETPIILLLHVPLVTMLYQQTEGATAPAPIDKVVRNNLKVLEMFKAHNLSLVLQGHLHINEFMRWNQTTFITGGALCGKWWQGSNFGTPPGFGIVTMGVSGVEWSYRTY